MDNALDKLFEEIREAAKAVEDAKAHAHDLNAKLVAATGEVDKACRRAKLLDQTLQKHIHEGLPVVQAKMVAHEEQDVQGVYHAVARDVTLRSHADSALAARLTTLERVLRRA